MPFDSIISNQGSVQVTDLKGTPDAIVAVSHSGVGSEVALGSSGTVLTSNGPTAAPTFQAVAGGVSSVNTRTGAITLVGTDIPVFLASGASHSRGGVPDPGGSAGTTHFLREDATWGIPAYPVTAVNSRTGSITLSGTDIPAFVASGASHAAGAVPDPGVTAGTTKFLREDATWALPAYPVTSVNTRTGAITLVAADLPTFIASGASHAVGGVPDPGASAGTTKFLREDATWAVPAGGSGVTSVNTRTGAVTLVATDIPTFVASGASHAAGAVPDPGGSAGTTHFLREDATWALPPVTSVNTRTGAIVLVGTDIPSFVASGASHAAGAVPDPGGSAGTTHFLREDATWAIPAYPVTSVNTRTGAITLLGTDIPAFVGSGASHAAGAVPDPGVTAGTTHFLCEDGTWSVPPGTGTGVSSVNTRNGAVTLVGTDIPSFVASGASHAAGAVPDPGASAGTTHFLREDATWAIPAYPVTSVNTRTGAITLVATDIPVFVASGASHAVGAVPDPGASAGTTHFLREDATWAVPAYPVTSVNTRTGAITLVASDIPVFVASGASHAAGAVPDPGGSAGTTKFLREDSTWQVPASSGVSSVNTRTGAVTLVATDIPVFVASGASHAAGAVPDPGVTAGTTKFLREDSTWQVPAGGGVSKYSTTFGNGSLTSFTITHSLGTRAVQVTIYDSSTFDEITCAVNHATTNTITIDTTGVVPTLNQYTVVVIG